MTEPTPKPTAKQPPPPGPGSPPPGPPPGLDADRHKATQAAADQAEKIIVGIFPMFVSMALAGPAVAKFSAHDCLVYAQRMMDKYGAPDDPTVCILIEQLLMAHLRALRLHGEAAEARAPEAVKVLNAAAARLHAEVRRTAVALAELMPKKPAGKRFKVANTG